MQANAQNLPFQNESFDAVLNVESSHRYPQMEKFLNEVYRVLKPNGYFLFTDFRNNPEIENLKKISHGTMNYIECIIHFCTENNIEVEIACTLVLLSTNQY